MLEKLGTRAIKAALVVEEAESFLASIGSVARIANEQCKPHVLAHCHMDLLPLEPYVGPAVFVSLCPLPPVPVHRPHSAIIHSRSFAPSTTLRPSLAGDPDPRSTVSPALALSL